MKRQDPKKTTVSKSKGGQKSKIKKSPICYITSNNQLHEDTNIQLNMKPIQTSFFNNSHFNSLILQTQSNDSGIQMYQSIINKLFKFLKRKLSVAIYNEIKYFFKNEIIKANSMMSTDSISSIFDLQSTSSRSDMKNGKRLKLSYDLCNNKQKSSKIDISHLKKCGKELHSLYSIIKGNHKMITKNSKPNKTQSNSKSRSTSRECSSNHTRHQLFSNQKNKKVVKVKHSLINKSQPLLNGKLLSKINIRVGSQIKYPPTKIPNIHSIVLKKKTTAKGNSSQNKYQGTLHCKSVTPVITYHHITDLNKSKNLTTLLFQNKPIASINQSSLIQAQINHDQTLSSETKGTNNINNALITEHDSNNDTHGKRNQCIESPTGNGPKSGNGNVRNEELMKTIKSTLDENLKIMFNFSYENFLSKESESESKNNSFQELNSNDQSDVHYRTTTNRKND